jgi:hypothetical protein
VKPIPKKQYLWVFLLFIFVFFISPQQVLSQKDKKKDKKERNEKVETKKHSPHKATLWALIPGAGQIYNKKYWKLPIVYAGFGVIGYFALFARGEYIKYNNAYVCSANADADTSYICMDPLGSNYETSYLLTYRDYYRRNMELSFILMGVWYILQMLDATVDAHLFYWEVDDDISVRLDPVYQPMIVPTRQPAYNGLKVTLKF